MGTKKDTAINKKEGTDETEKGALTIADIAKEQYELDSELEQFNITQFVNSPMSLSCGDWICDKTGVYKLLPSKENPNDLIRYEATYQQILPVGIIENIETGERKLKLAFSVKDRHERFNWKEIKTDPIICGMKGKITTLANLGVAVDDNNAKKLISYLSDMLRINQGYIPIKHSISHLGWIGNTFFPYDDDIVFDGDNEQERVVQGIHEQGNYILWREQCIDYRKNLTVRLIMDVSFASALVELIDGLCFVTHLWGGTGTGKTVALLVAASIWGNPESIIISADATQNFITNRASFLKNLPIFIDETQINKAFVEKMIYSLTEGRPRGRLSRDSKEKGNKSWLNTSILTGEAPVVNIHSGAGAVNRVLEVELDGPLFENFANTVSVVKNNYGFAGKQFIQFLQNSDKKILKDKYFQICKSLEQYNSTGKQTNNLAFLILTDQLVGECIFHGEKTLDIEAVAGIMKSKDEVSLPERAYQRVLDWIASNPNRFTDYNNSGELWGKLDDSYAYIIKGVLDDFLQKNEFSFDSVKKEWVNKGYLIKGTDGKYTISVRMGKQIRCVKLLNGQEDNVVDKEDEFHPVQEEIPFN